MLKVNEIAVGVVAWPDPSFFTADAGCAMPYSIHRTIHPMVCIERNDTHGVWLTLSSKGKTLAGRRKMAIPASWKIGSQSWIGKPSFVGDLTTSIIIPHQVMAQATAKAEFECTLRHRISTPGADELLALVKRAQGYTLGNNPTAKAVAAPAPKVILKRKAVPVVAVRQRLTTEEYAELLDRHGRGETIEELARTFAFPAKRIQSYIDYRRRTARLMVKPTLKSDLEIDLSQISIQALRAMLAEKERMEVFEHANRQIADLAKSLGVEITALELARATASPSIAHRQEGN